MVTTLKNLCCGEPPYGPYGEAAIYSWIMTLRYVKVFLSSQIRPETCNAQGNEYVEFFGYGPHESYIDKHRSTYKEDLKQRYQKCMRITCIPGKRKPLRNRVGPCTNALGMGLLFVGMDEFSFNASIIRLKTLQRPSIPMSSGNNLKP